VIARLYTYFGLVGIASIVAWGAALLLLAAFARSRRRTRAYLAALALSLIGFALAKINSHNISEIEVDRSLVGGASPPREGASKADEPKPGPIPAYREAGIQKRDEAAKLKPSDLTAIAEEADVSVARRLPEADVLRADAYDRLNLFFARLVPWLALAVVCLDYLSRFNRTLGCVAPIPIAGRTVDALFPKTHAVHLQTSSPVVVRRYLDNVVRKGETFVYLGPADPVPVSEVLRWRLRKWGWRSLKKIVASGGGFPTSDFILDSAWFGRYCFVAAGTDVARGLLADLVAYLDSRTGPRAAARRTVNVVWDFAEPLPVESLKALVPLCRETNFKLVVFSPAPPDAEAAALFDEQVSLSEGG